MKTHAEPQGDERRHSPAKCTGVTNVVISANPDETKIYQPRRAAKRHDADADSPLDPDDERFQQKLENHKAAVALHFAWYNFCEIHGSLKVTPAMEAGLRTMCGA